MILINVSESFGMSLVISHMNERNGNLSLFFWPICLSQSLIHVMMHLDTSLIKQYSTGWWFGTFFIFPYIGNNHPNWLIFFRGLKPPTSPWFWVVCLMMQWLGDWHPKSGPRAVRCHRSGCGCTTCALALVLRLEVLLTKRDEPQFTI